MLRRPFKWALIKVGVLGLTWGALEFWIDMVMRDIDQSLETIFLQHVVMGVLCGYLMMLTYLKFKTTQKRHISDLYASEQQLRMIFEHVPLGIVYCNRTGVITKCNDTFAQIIGTPREKIIGVNFMQVEDEDMKASLKSAFKGTTGYFEGNYTSGISGRTRYLKAIFRGMIAENDEFLGYVGIFEDKTSQRLMEREMKRLDRLDLVGQMSASIGHEIRNPMTTVRGFLQLLSNREIDLIKKEYYKLMINELDCANSIITEFLSLAKDKRVELESKCINQVIDSVYPLISSNALEEDKNILFEKGDVPTILLDETEIRQLIFNLVRNGLEATPVGSNLTIRTYFKDDEVVLSVQDEGSGIDAEVLDKIGTPFFTTKEKGTGLGLSVCYSIAERHQAKIEIKTSSAGTTFLVRFNTTTNGVTCQKVS